MHQVWRDVIGYAGLYEVSNIGAVRNAATKKTLQPYNDGGYNKVVLSRGALDKRYVKVSRLVAEAFVPNPFKLPEVCHKDGIRDHDQDFNLEWCHRSEHKANKPVVVLNEEMQPIALYRSLTSAAEAYGYSVQLVSKKCKEHTATREGLYFYYYDEVTAHDK